MKEKLEEGLKKALIKEGIANPKVHIEHPEDISHGDFTTNIALVYSKSLNTSAKLLAEKIVEEFNKNMPEEIVSVNIAGPCFINFKVKDLYFHKEVLKIGKDFGKISLDAGKKIMVEYTDPNPFKIFHIGHLMANTIGETLSRLVEFSGAEVIRTNYYGDVGLHVAKTIWSILENKNSFPKESDDLLLKMEFLGKMYVLGSQAYEEGSAKEDIAILNKKIFEKSDKEVNHFYDLGKKWSLEYFESIYKKLGTKFDEYFPESEVADLGIKIVKEFEKKGIFEKSDGATIFPGEKYGVHTRVFITSQGLPTYEAKELGLTKKKFEKYPDLSLSIVVTANEQNDYFKVLLKTIASIYPEIAEKMKHISHGILRPSSGKMSSRKGNIVSAEDLLSVFEELVIEKMKDREWDEKDKKNAIRMISVAALKYTILRQSIGGDIIYDPEKAVSFEGDSGPYLQYSCVRAKAVIKKAQEVGISNNAKKFSERAETIERLLVRFPEVVERARLEYSPQYISTYLIELASAFNSYYASNKIIDEKDPLSPYRVSIAKAFANVMENGLWVLGMRTPEKM